MKRKKSKDCFSLRLNVSFLSWFHFLFHSGGFPFLVCSLLFPEFIFPLRSFFLRSCFFLLGCSHSLALFGVFSGLATATALAADPVATCQGSRPAQPSSCCSAPQFQLSSSNRLRTFWSQIFSHTQPPTMEKCRNSCLMGSSNTEFREEGGKEEACMTPILFRKRGFT